MHQPSAGIGGTTADIAIQAENLEFTKRAIERITAEHTGQSVETIARDGDRDRWFTAEQALDYGHGRPCRRVRCATSDPAGQPDGWGCRHEHLHDPDRRGAHPARRALLRRLQPAAAERIIFLGTEIDDGVANVVIAQLLHLASESPEQEIGHLHQLARRLVHLADGDLRHDPVRTTPTLDVLRRPGGLDGGGAARRRRRRAALRARALPGAAGPAVRRRRGHDLGPRAAGRRGPAHPRPGRGGAEPPHRASGRDDPADIDRDRVFTAAEAVDYGLADAIITTQGPPTR